MNPGLDSRRRVAIPRANPATSLARWGGLLLALPSLVGCAPEPRGFDRYALFHTLTSGGRVQWSAPEGPLLERARWLADRLEMRTKISGEVQSSSIPGSTPPPIGSASPSEPDTREERRSEAVAARMLLRTFEDPEVFRLLAPTGIRPTENGGFRVFGQIHDDPTDTLVACFADPADPSGQRPLVLYAGRDARSVALRAREVPAPWVPRLSTWADGGPGISVELRATGEPILRTFVDRLSTRRIRRARSEVHEGKGVRLHTLGDVASHRLIRYRRECEEAVQRVETWLKAELESPIEVFLYARADEFERELGEASLGWLDRPSLSVHALLAEGLPDDSGAEVARAAALSLRGEPAIGWLEDAIAVAAAKSWWGRPIYEWLAFLRHGELMPSVDQIQQDSSEGLFSEHVLAPARARAILRADIQAGPLLEAWTRGEPLPFGGTALAGRTLDEQELRDRRAKLVPDSSGTPRGGALQGVAPKGMRSPYLGHGIERSLADLESRGANSFSLTIQVTSDEVDPVLFRGLRPVHSLSSDVALASAVAAGHGVGLDALLVVEPLFASWSTWGDGVNFAESDDMQQFFAGFHRTAIHYAVLAELLGIERLCLGSALTGASNTVAQDGDPPWVQRAKHGRRQGWNALIKKVRRIYDGELTYAARSVYELGRVSFWEHLDRVGLLGFRPVSASAALPTEERIRTVLREQFSELREFSEKLGRPGMFIALGLGGHFDSLARDDVPKGDVFPRTHRRYFEALAELLEGEDAQGVGYHLWNWGIDPTAIRPGGQSPHAGEGEEFLATILGRSGSPRER